MASTDMASTTTTPQVKFENSPTESCLSVPGESYPSLFDNAQPSANVMTPPPDRDGASPDVDEEGTPAPESGDKKQPKKRKSWGQVLPEPKTNLPPRYEPFNARHASALTDLFQETRQD